MVIIEDTRQQEGKHKAKHTYFEKHEIRVVRSKLPVGDYAKITDMTTIVDTKKDIQEVCGNVTKGHKRFVGECDLAAECGIKLIILIDDKKVSCLDDLETWENPRLKYSPKATTGITLAKILRGMEMRHGVKFEFCHPRDSGKRVLELLNVQIGEDEKCG